MWAPDRLHFSPIGHNTIARMVLNTLGVPNDLKPCEPGADAGIPWRQARAEDLSWARTHFAPWIMRRLRGRSSGDHIQPKRPTLRAASGLAALPQPTSSVLPLSVLPALTRSASTLDRDERCQTGVRHRPKLAAAGQSNGSRAASPTRLK